MSLRNSRRWDCASYPMEHRGRTRKLQTPQSQDNRELPTASHRQKLSTVALSALCDNLVGRTIVIAPGRLHRFRFERVLSIPVLILTAYWSCWCQTRVRFAIVTLAGLPPVPSGCATQQFFRSLFEVVRRDVSGTRRIAS